MGVARRCHARFLAVLLTWDARGTYAYLVPQGIFGRLRLPAGGRGAAALLPRFRFCLFGIHILRTPSSPVQ
eukprot:gene3540-biopygen432